MPGRGSRNWRRGRRGRRGNWRRRFWRGYRSPVYLSYPQTYYVEQPQSIEYNNCVYASGKCPELLEKEFGKNLVNNPYEGCKQEKVREFVETLPDECKPKEEYINKGEWIGVL